MSSIKNIILLVFGMLDVEIANQVNQVILIKI